MTQSKQSPGDPRRRAVAAAQRALSTAGQRAQRNGHARPPTEQPPAKPATRPIVAYRPFPLAALPPFVGSFVRQAAASLGCDPSYVALPTLAVLAAAIGNTRVLRLKNGWDATCILWTVIIGDSGTLKSPAWSRATQPLRRRQAQLVDDHRQQLATYRREQAARQASGGEPPDKPTLQRVLCGDTTVERLAELLQDSPRGLLVSRDELAGWIGSFTRYKSRQGGSDAPNWLEMHRAGTICVDRKTGERRTLFIERAAVSVAGGIQPGILARALTAELMECGLAARLLMAMPPKKPKHWTDAEVDPATIETYDRLVDDLLALDFADKKNTPRVLCLDPDAKRLWVAWYDRWASVQVAAEGEMAFALAKLEEYAARLALLHHSVGMAVIGDNGCSVSVGADSVQAGIDLAEWFGYEARRIYATIRETEAELDTRRLLEHIRQRGGKITVKELQRSNSRRYPMAEVAEDALSTLVEDGLAIWEDRAPGPQGGRPTRILALLDHDEEPL